MAAHRTQQRNGLSEHRPVRHRLKALTLAVMGAFPGVAVMAAPPDLRLPVAHDGSQTLNGKTITFTPANAAGRVKLSTTVTGSSAQLDVTQLDTRAVTQWQSFNVGADAAVNFYMPNAQSAMLARVVPTSAAQAQAMSPSQILGAVRTLYLDGAGKAQVGGELFLINAAGWLFSKGPTGNGATINVGGLIASTLDVRNDDFMNGLGSIARAESTFSWQYANGGDQTTAQAAALYRAGGFVQVDAGVNITTSSGGRVFLFAPTVNNEGTIKTPGGQTVLAGGGEVFLNNPQNEKLYASEVNPNVPALRGLLVEVNNGPNGETGNVRNAGEIITASGNTTLVAMAVRQAGHISANTSSAGNGSVVLTARSGVKTSFLGASTSTSLVKQAQNGGQLTLERSSRIDLLPDESNGGVTAGTSFTTSRVELSGKTIDLWANSQIKAPNAVVQVRAEATPTYMGVNSDPTFASKDVFGDTDKGARITLGANAVIDVSGTTTAVVNGARNYVTPTLVTNNDLKDSPLQKLGPLFHSTTATFDSRQAVPMFGNIQGYKDAMSTSITERMAAGGTVDLHSTGQVVTNASSVVNVSGGQVNFTSVGKNPGDTTVLLTQLKDSSGNLVTLNTAQGNRSYTLAKSLRVMENAYTQGAAAGGLKVTGSQIVMPGQVLATTVSGQRQIAGLDPLAQRATIAVNAWLNVNDRKAALVDAATTTVNLEIGQQAASAGQTFWDQIEAGAEPEATALPKGSSLGMSIMQAQAGSVSIQTDGGLHWLSGNQLTFTPGASLSLTALGSTGLSIDSSIRDASGNVSLTAGNITDTNGAILTHTRGITLAAGESIDASGRFVNQMRDGKAIAPTGVTGGTISLSSASSLTLGAGSLLDVSGGAVWSANSVFKGYDGGSLTVASSTDVSVGAAAGIMTMKGELRGYGFNKGGSLSLAAAAVQIGGDNNAEASTLTVLDPAFFTRQGFASYSIEGRDGLTVAAGTSVQPVQQNRALTSAVAKAASDTPVAAISRVVDKGADIRSATNLALSSALGSIVVGANASVETDALATVSLKARTDIDMEGRIVDHGGNVSLAHVPPDSGGNAPRADRTTDGVIWLGQNSQIDVSGKAIITPNAGSLRQGRLLDGGTVTLDAADATRTPGLGSVVVVSQGASIDISGAADRFDVRVAGSSGSKAQTLDVFSAGGTLNVHGSHGVVLEGSVKAQGGNSTAVAGSLNLSVTATNLPLGVDDTEKANLPHVYRITLQADDAGKSAGKTFDQRFSLLQDNSIWGNATLSSGWLTKAGFADISLTTSDRIEAAQSMTLSAVRSLNLSAASIYAAPGQTLTLKAPDVDLGNSRSTSVDNGLNADATASSGSGVLDVQAMRLGLNGQLSLQGIGQVNLSGFNEAAAQVLELRGGPSGQDGYLNTQADLHISAKQIFPDTDERYTVNASGHLVSLLGGDASQAKPLSAGGQLTINAQRIEQGSVLRAPFGHITLTADNIDLLAGSETSVSGAGLLVPFGSTINGLDWVYNGSGDIRTSLIGKQISFNTSASTNGKLTVADTASIDASGGGDVFAREFIPGPGGSKDIFTGAANGAFAIVPLASANQSGFAVSDRAILAATDAAGKSASITAGEQITFGVNKALPQGTYVVLPAAYASLPGAYLVKADTDASRAGANDLNAPTYKLDDGSFSVAAKISYAGTSYVDSTASRFVVMSSKLASTYSQVNLTSGNAYFGHLAAKQQSSATQLPQDAGVVRILSPILNQLAPGVLKLGGDASQVDALGGTLELGVDKLHVGDVALGDASTSELSAAALNGSGAQSLILGATRGGLNASGERELIVSASDVRIDASASAGALRASDITLVSSGTLSLGGGAAIEASGAGTAEAFHVSGDGASVRVSADPSASLTRSGTANTVGALNIGPHASLKSLNGAVLLEGTQSVALNASASLLAKAISLGAPQLSFGQAPAQASGLVLSDALLGQLALASNLSLRSYSSVDFYKPQVGNALTIGGAQVARLTLDAGTLQGHDGVNVNMEAGQVVLANSSGVSATATSSALDSGQLRISATAAQGDLTVSTGLSVGAQTQASQIGVGGFQSTTLAAGRSVIMDGKGGRPVFDTPQAGGAGGLSVLGDLDIRAHSLTASSGSNTTLQATGALSITASVAGNAARATSGLGAHLQIKANSIVQGGTLDLRSGGLTMLATGVPVDGSPALSFLSGSQTLLGGTVLSIGGQTVYTSGGFGHFTASQGDISMARGALVDVSAPAGGGGAGQLSFLAATGHAQLDGQLLGTAGSGQQGASLDIDALSVPSLDQLAINNASVLAAQGLGNFTAHIGVRSRGDEGLVLSAGHTLTAAELLLASDQGSISIAGNLNADAANGGSLTLAAGQDLTLDGASLSARALLVSANTPSSAGRISLQSAGGMINVLNNTQIDLSAADPAANGGVLALRASRTASGDDVNIAPLSATVTGASSVQIEAVKRWSFTGDTSPNVTKLLSDAQTFSGKSGNVLSRLAAGNAALQSQMQLRSGEEVDVNGGNLTISKDWNLSALDTLGNPLAGALPVNLTLRATGDLIVKGSVSTGFSSALATGIAQSGFAGDISLVAGADLQAANSLNTVQGQGNLLIGNGSKAVMVRSTNGQLQLAAGQDIQLQTSNAAVYTTGTQVGSGDLTSYQALPATNKIKAVLTSATSLSSAGTVYAPLKSGTVAVGPFYTGGGSVFLSAGHDVLGTAATDDTSISPAAWLYTAYLSKTQQTSWWTRYDKFAQGVATLGGGNVSVKAGGSVQDLQVAAAGGGYQQGITGGVTRNFGAGSLSVTAGQDILATNALSTGDSLSLQAGQSIGASANGGAGSAANGSSVLSFNAANRVSALGNIDLAAAGNAARAAQFLAVLTSNDITQDALNLAYWSTDSLGQQSALDMRSAAGSISVAATSDLLNKVSAANRSPDFAALDLTASHLSITAPGGDIKLLAPQNQVLPAGGGLFQLIAGQSLTLGTSDVGGLYQRGAAAGGLNDSADAYSLGLDTSTQRQPIVLVAGRGDLTLAGKLNVVSPVQASAHQDIVVQDALTIQHQSVQDLSIFQAGRDIQFKAAQGSTGDPSIVVRGPGNLVLVAGRDLNLGVRDGVVANGNTNNSALLANSAHITLMAGVNLSSLNASLAASEGRLPSLLGGLAYLSGLTADQQLAAVRNALTLLGDGAKFDAALASAEPAFVATLGPAYAGLSNEQKLAAFYGLDADTRGNFIKDFLSNHVLGDASKASAAAPQDFNLTRLMQAALSTQGAADRSQLAGQLAVALQSPYLAEMQDYVRVQTGATALTPAQALDAFSALPVARQALFEQRVLFNELRQSGRSAVLAGSLAQKAADYQRGYDAMAALFSAAHAQSSGDILLPVTKVRTLQGSDINMLAPVGNVDGGVTSATNGGTDVGVVALGGGNVNATLDGNFLVNTSRVFTLGGGNLLMWSSNGNIDAGKGARTALGAPAPVYYVDDSGNLREDITAAISGSGIASSNELDVYAPHGIVDSGDAGLRAAGGAYLGALKVVCLGCSFSGPVLGLPSASPPVSPPLPPSALPDSTKSGPTAGESEEEKKKKKKKREIQIDFLGFGLAFLNPMDWLGVPGLSLWPAQAESTPVDRHVSELVSDQPEPQPRSVLLSWFDGFKQRLN